ncbi:MAG: T9SS type A sorting domain-containing protein, partial [Sphingobacteriales bacterium]
GTDTAYNVFVRDTLDSNLDWNSLGMISSSHKYALTVKDGNQLEWFFTNVKLPDSNINEKASHGYIAYRIKPKGTLAEGDSVTNKASIYFDFNLAANTNNNKTFIRSNIVTAVIDLNNKESQLYLYPNPTNGQVVVSKSNRLKGNAVLQVRDINGKLLRQLNYGLIYTENFRKSVDLHNLSRGYYLISLRVGKSVYQGKLIIQ